MAGLTHQDPASGVQIMSIQQAPDHSSRVNQYSVRCRAPRISKLLRYISGIGRQRPGIR